MVVLSNYADDVLFTKRFRRVSRKIAEGTKHEPWVLDQVCLNLLSF